MKGGAAGAKGPVQEAQQESLELSVVEDWAAILSPSAVVRYGLHRLTIYPHRHPGLQDCVLPDPDDKRRLSGFNNRVGDGTELID